VNVGKELDKKIEKKKQELTELARQLGEGRAYLAALEDTRKLLPKEASGNQEFVPRLGSDVAKVLALLKQEGAPLHIDVILSKLGKPADKKTKVSLSGSMAAYVRDGKLFSRPAPNTFGLLEFDRSKTDNDEPPADFGVER